MKRYVVVGGTPFTGYTGTTSFVSIKPLYFTDDLEEAKAAFEDFYDECAGLLVIIDNEKENMPEL